STTRRYGGTGLGLTISQRFCQMMGGTITIDSQLGQGSTFTVMLPQFVTDQKQSSQEVEEPRLLRNTPTSKEQSSINPTSPQHTLLVIDDDPTTRDLIVRSLSVKGMTIETASSGEEGLRKAKELHPDVITLDIVMPSLDGWSVLSALKADPELADIPVIVLSFVSDKTQGFTLGASDYLIKPVDSKRLAHLVRKYQPQPPDQNLSTESSILIIEDDQTTRQMLHDCLEKEGWQIEEAEDGSAALKYLAQNTPSLIVLDLVLPQMSGFELIDILHNAPQWSNIPIIVTTALDLTSAEIAQLRQSVEQVLQKGSYGCDDLLHDIQGLVSARLKTASFIFSS
ncbi:MAG: response regulator, partial [Cyanobacteriota bacterium]|nr:response regulator [Cyanobacteriota bacterium]